MKKVTVLKHKIIRAYNNSVNKGYPENRYFGFESLKDLIKTTVKSYIHFYGNNLRHWHYKT